jgi:hypothetical protein
MSVSDGRLLRTGSANFSWSGETRQDNDLVALRGVSVCGGFDAKFDRAWDNRRNDYPARGEAVRRVSFPPGGGDERKASLIGPPETKGRPESRLVDLRILLSSRK